MEAHPAFVIQSGDLVARGKQDELWKTYDEIVAPLKQVTQIYPARGNHDVGGTGYEDRITFKTNSGNKLWYSFNKERCHFVTLAIDEYTEYSVSSPQYQWLISDLESVKGKFDHIIVSFHVPPYSIGAHASDLQVRATLCPVFEKYGVDAVLTGHDHNYYRTVRNDVTYIVSGGGGAPLYDQDPKKGAIEGDFWVKANHFVIFDVAGKRILGRVIGLDGKALESFTINSRAKERK